MLQNQSFETTILEEQLSTSENELMVLEEFNALNEAVETQEKDGKSLGVKAKEFFIKVIKAIKEALKKFMNFFVDAFNKLFSRFNKIEEYIKQSKLEGTVDKEKQEEAFVLLAKKVNVKAFNPGNANIEKSEQEINHLQSLLGSEKSASNSIYDARILKDKASVESAMKDSRVNMNVIKSAAKSIQQGAKSVEASAKEGIQASGKDNKELIKQKQAETKLKNKGVAVARRFASLAISNNNEVLVKSYKVAKAISSQNKASQKAGNKAVKAQNKDADKKAKAMNA
ncbi:hypothetical protein [Staphylococcus phage LY01]|nr:hypothetical protein [Staphylococcus phage LY01]